MSFRPASIKVRALQWLSQREHSRTELRSKLLRLLTRDARVHPQVPSDALTGEAQDLVGGIEAPDPALEVDALLQWLALHGYLSDARFVESRVHARQSRFGDLRIRQELKQHGLAMDADTQQALRQTEEQRARAVWRRKYTEPAANATTRVRQMRFLAGRGFSADVVRRVVLGRASADDDNITAPDDT